MSVSVSPEGAFSIMLDIDCSWPWRSQQGLLHSKVLVYCTARMLTRVHAEAVTCQTAVVHRQLNGGRVDAVIPCRALSSACLLVSAAAHVEFRHTAALAAAEQALCIDAKPFRGT